MFIGIVLHRKHLNFSTFFLNTLGSILIRCAIVTYSTYVVSKFVSQNLSLESYVSLNQGKFSSVLHNSCSLDKIFLGKSLYPSRGFREKWKMYNQIYKKSYLLQLKTLSINFWPKTNMQNGKIAKNWKLKLFRSSFLYISMKCLRKASKSLQIGRYWGLMETGTR